MAYYGNRPVAGEDNSFKVLDDISSYTETFDGANSTVVSASDDTIKIYDHRFVQGQRVTYTHGGGDEINGLTTATAYYVIRQDKDTIQLAETSTKAADLDAIDISLSGTTGSSHTLNIAFDSTNTKFKATTNGRHVKLTRPGQLQISINGVVQQPVDSTSPSNGFGIDSNNVIVFSVAPDVNDTFWGNYLTSNLSSWEMSDNKVDNFTGDASTVQFSLSKIPANNESVMVTLDGVLQHPSDATNTRAYKLVGQDIIFTSAPAFNVAIQVRHIGFAGSSGGSGGVTGFYGRTGNVKLIRADLQNTDIYLNNLTGVAATFTGNVSVGGTLTYTDVTNIDSVGIITAQAGIHLGIGATAGKFEAATGITTFSTSVGIADSIHHVGNNDTSIRFPGDDIFAVETAGAERLRIDASGRMMIGNGQAANVLDAANNLVVGGGSGSEGITIYSGGSDGGFIAFADGTSDPSYRMGQIIYDHGGNEMLFRTNGNTNRLLIDSSGNIGQGTATPTTPNGTNADNPNNGLVFTMYGDSPAINLVHNVAGGSAAADDYAAINFGRTGSSTNPYRAVIGYKQSDDLLRINAQNAITFDTSGDINSGEALRIDSSGRTLIGHTASLSEGCLLQVARANDNTVELFGYSANANGARINFTKSRNGTVGINTIVQDGDTIGELHFRAANGDGQYFRVAAIEAEIDGGVGVSSLPGRLIFSTTAPGATTQSERLRINSSGQLITGGNATPYAARSATFQNVAGQTNTYISIVAGSTSAVSGLTFGDTAAAAAGNYAGMFQYYHDGDYITYKQNAEEKLRITSAGRIGIADGGATALSNRIEIVEDPEGFPDDSAQPQAIVLIKSGTSGTNRRWVGIGASNTSAWIQSSSPGGSGLAAPLAINPGSGNVGIGLTLPAEKLDVNGTIQCLNELRSKTGNDLLLNAGSANRDVKIQVNDVNMLYVKGDTGRVGIGTDVPTNALDVQGGTTNTAIVARSTDAKAQISLLDNSTTSVGSVVIGAEGDELFLTSGSGGTEGLRIKSTGYAEFAGAADVRLTLGSQGTAGSNTANWVRGQAADLLYNAASGSHVWEIGGTETMRINTTGGVGIGASLYHLGNPETMMEYGTDSITLRTENKTRVYIDKNHPTWIRRDAVGIHTNALLMNYSTNATGNGVALGFAPTQNYDSRYCSIEAVNQDGNNNMYMAFKTVNAALDDHAIEHIRIQSTGQILYSAASGDNQITSKRTNAAGSNGNYFFHLKATNNLDNEVGALGFHRDSATDDARFIVKTRETGGSSIERFRIHPGGGFRLWDSASAYEAVDILHTEDYSNGTMTIQPVTNPGSGIASQWIYLKNLGSGSGSTNMNLGVQGAVSKGSGSFRIPHPLPALKDTKELLHSFIEGPQCDNIYRGKVTLSSGTATVNIDTVSNMTDGTFVALNRDIQCFTSNETGWDAVKGSVSGNILTITSQNNSSTDTISWMVVGERQDPTIKESVLTDDDGNLIVEVDKGGS